jgi:plasmid maintenance system antidote protein VapI
MNISILRGIHPGLILARELKRRKLGKGRFAISLDEYPQTLGDITIGKRRMNTPLAIKIEESLGIEEGYFMTLQVYHDIKEEKTRQAKGHHPDLAKIRQVLFWDTEIEKIDWQRQKWPVIRRVFERGDAGEKEEITRFYGKETIDSVMGEKERQKT